MNNKIDFAKNIKTVIWPFILVAGWVFFTKIIRFVPFLGCSINLFLSPLTWLIKIAGAVWVGYSGAKSKIDLTNIVIAGAIYGFIVGIFDVIATFVFHFLRPGFVGLLTFNLSLILVLIYTTAAGAVITFICGLVFSSKK